jgi:starch-binding outer membrane protein, SusD/RagB family
MKKLLYYSLIISAVAVTACTKNLDQAPISSVAVSNFYQSTNDFQQAVTGVYSRLRSYPDQALWLRELRSDNVIASSDGNRDWQGINDFSPNLTTTAFIVNTWVNDFNAIYNANVVLDNINKKGSVITDTTLRNRFTAECRFLRAFFYFDLVRFYGKVPIVNGALSPKQVATVPRSPVPDVYNFIIQDLQYAIANLPSVYSGSDIGRATSGAAKGILGLVYLTKSGPTYNVEGPGLDSKEYDKAVALFNDIINSGQYQFLSTYPQIFSYTNENNKEVLFDVQFMSTNNGADFPSQLVPSAYWTGLGLTTYGNGFGSTSFNVSKSLLQSYKTSAGSKIDVRDTFSIKKAFALSTSTPNVLDSSRAFIKKYIDINRKGIDRADWPINFIVLRYTDILLMKAECILHGAGGTQTDANAIVNQVRARAGVPALSTDVTLDQLMEERRREFIGEGLRWNDLVREGMAVTSMNNWIASDNITSIHQVIPQFIIYPVPQQELLATPGLYEQNNGYY